MKLTTDTITDEQIMALFLISDRVAANHPDADVCDDAQFVRELCEQALGRVGASQTVRTKARARCAEILNAKSAK